MSAEEIENAHLKGLLEDLKLMEYHVNFINERVFFSDLGGILEEDLLDIIPKRIHRRRLMKHLNSAKEEDMRKAKTLESEKSIEMVKEEELVQMLVKCDQNVENVYDVPLDSTNEQLIGKLVMAFLGPCQVKLQDEKRQLVPNLKSFTLRKWFEKNEWSPEDEIRAVLSVKWPNVKKTGGEVEKLKQELERLKVENVDNVQKLEKENLKLEQENKRLKSDLEKNAQLCSMLEGKLAKSVVASERNRKEKRESENWKHVMKQIETAWNLHYGLNGLDVDFNKAYRTLKRIEREKHGRMYYLLGFFKKGGCGTQKDLTKANYYFDKAAEYYSSKNADDLDPEDWTVMGVMYRLGRGFKKNVSKGMKLLNKAVDAGEVVGVYNLAYCFQYGDGVLKNYTKAVRLYTKAVDEFSMPAAMCYLAIMYESGHGFKKDAKQGFKLYLRSARRGERTSMNNVGLCYSYGRGVRLNNEEARKWFQMAVDHGYENAKRELRKLST